MARPESTAGGRNSKRGFGGRAQRPVLAVALPLAGGIGGATAYPSVGRGGTHRHPRFPEHCHHRVVARHRAPPLALIAPPSPVERRPQILRASQPATEPPPATRQRVVLLPHVRAELTDIRPQSRRAGRVTGMDQDNSPPQHPTESDGRTRVIAANLQWHDAELALKVARHCFERWRVAGPQDSPLPATMQRLPHPRGALARGYRVSSPCLLKLSVPRRTPGSTPRVRRRRPCPAWRSVDSRELIDIHFHHVGGGVSRSDRSNAVAHEARNMHRHRHPMNRAPIRLLRTFAERAGPRTVALPRFGSLDDWVDDQPQVMR